jgi:hypothetical protein
VVVESAVLDAAPQGLPEVPGYRVEARAGGVILEARWPDLGAAPAWLLRVSWALGAAYVALVPGAVLLGLFIATPLLLLGRAHAKGSGAFRGHLYLPPPRRIVITPRTPAHRYREVCPTPSLIVNGREVPRGGLRVQVTCIDSRRRDRFAVSLVLADSVLRLSRFDDDNAAFRLARALSDLLDLPPPEERIATEQGVGLPESRAPALYLLLGGLAVVAFERAILDFWGSPPLQRALMGVLFLALQEILHAALLRRARSEAKQAALRTFDLQRS